MKQEPSRRSVVTTGFLALLLTVALIVFSEQGYHATVAALKLFFEVVFPSLLPFFILSDVLLATGMVHFLGVFFEPLMRPLFNVPGVGSIVITMGLAAGYPMDAVLTAKFRKQGLCSKTEAERLLAFSNMADPLFIYGAVAVGMFGQPLLGAVLAAAHYASGLTVGLLFRFYGPRSGFADRRDVPRQRGSLLGRALSEMYQARVADGRPWSRVLNEAINESVSTLFMIMCFIVLFAVLLRVLDAVGVLQVLGAPLALIFSWVGFSPHLVPAALSGLFEIDLGSAAAAAARAVLTQRLVLVSAIIAWSGLSVHGQVASVLADTDISMGPYFAARFIHALLAGLYTFILVRPMDVVASSVILPAFAARDWVAVPTVGLAMGDAFHYAIVWAALSVAALTVGAVAVGVIRTVRVVVIGMGTR
jgi:sporulation integral membrane protein YlbJ